MGASVKIMLSYDYCHFEVCKSTDQEISDAQIDGMRKDCQRLADKAVKQYQTAKAFAERRDQGKYEEERFRAAVEKILQKPAGERTVNELAMVKQSEDESFYNRFRYDYDYEDEFDEGRLED